MRQIDRFLREPRMTEPRYWTRYDREPWFKALKSQLQCSKFKLAEDLAETAQFCRTEDYRAVVKQFQANHGLQRDAQWKPRNQWGYRYSISEIY